MYRVSCDVPVQCYSLPLLQWHWHMIDNLEVNSIGVASRWLLGVDQHYQNAVHSNLQFFSPYIW